MTNEETHPFQLTAEKLEAALQRAKKQVAIAVSSDFSDFPYVFFKLHMLLVSNRLYIFIHADILEQGRGGPTLATGIAFVSVICSKMQRNSSLCFMNRS